MTEYEKFSLNWKTPKQLINTIPHLIMTNDVDAIKYIVESKKIFKGFNNTQLDSFYMSLLVHSAMYNSVDVVSYLFDNKNVNDYLKYNVSNGEQNTVLTMINIANDKKNSNILKLILHNLSDIYEKQWFTKHPFSNNIYELKELEERLVENLNNNSITNNGVINKRVKI